MALEDPDRWQELQEQLKSIIPTIRRLRHTPQQALLFDTITAKGLSANQVSEGTLLMLGLLTAIYSKDRPGLILLDDLDRGLHPKAQRDLIALLRKLLANNPELLIVCVPKKCGSRN
jgi:predicted ATPase